MSLFKLPPEDIERCVRQMESVRTGEDVGYVMQQISPTLAQLRGGKMVTEQIEKLLRAGNPDRAIKLLHAMPRTKKAPVRFIQMLGPVWILGAVFGFGFLLPRCDGAYDPAFQAINQCPQAVELLGAPIEHAPLGFACGSSESGGGSGRANWQLRVKGNKGSGTYRYAGSNLGHGWQLHFANLEANGQTISIIPCGAATTEALSGAVELDGTVELVTGNTSVKAGEACTVAVSPAPDEARHRGFNCHVKVKCGANVLYGWEGAGATHCKAAAGQATHADDTQGATAGDDPLLALDLAAKTCNVSDDGDKAFNVKIRLE